MAGGASGARRWHRFRIPNAQTVSRAAIALYPYNPHYADSSIVVFVPHDLRESADGINMIVHFHGHLNDNMGVLETYMLPQAMEDEHINAILVLPQGPYRARDSFSGKMEDADGLKHLVEDVLSTMKREGVIKEAKVHRMVLTAHSGGYHPAAFCVDRGGMNDHITHLFLFDAFYGNLEYFRNWLSSGKGIIEAAYTEHLKEEHTGFAAGLDSLTAARFHVRPSTVEHDQVPQTYMRPWLRTLPDEWKTAPTTLSVTSAGKNVRTYDTYSSVEACELQNTSRQFMYPPTEKIKIIEVENFPLLGKLTAFRFVEWVLKNPGGVISLPTGKTPEHFIKWVGRILERWETPEIRQTLAAYGVDGSRRPDMESLHFVQIDEFYPMDATQLNSFYWYVNEFYIRGIRPAARKRSSHRCNGSWPAGGHDHERSVSEQHRGPLVACAPDANRSRAAATRNHQPR